jgi:bisphosphoglycerate-independent phosphoglycerate mutase (AlkP superfamily)
MRNPRPALSDLAPTILADFGVTAPREMTGENVL